MNLNKKVPVLYRKKEECCGCGACLNICPVEGIVMQSDEEGFEYPVVIENKCIRCYQCIKACPTKAHAGTDS